MPQRSKPRVVERGNRKAFIGTYQFASGGQDKRQFVNLGFETIQDYFRATRWQCRSPIRYAFGEKLVGSARVLRSSTSLSSHAVSVEPARSPAHRQEPAVRRRSRRVFNRIPGRVLDKRGRIMKKAAGSWPQWAAPRRAVAHRAGPARFPPDRVVMEIGDITLGADFCEHIFWMFFWLRLDNDQTPRCLGQRNVTRVIDWPRAMVSFGNSLPLDDQVHADG